MTYISFHLITDKVAETFYESFNKKCLRIVDFDFLVYSDPASKLTCPAFSRLTTPDQFQLKIMKKKLSIARIQSDSPDEGWSVQCKRKCLRQGWTKRLWSTLGGREVREAMLRQVFHFSLLGSPPPATLRDLLMRVGAYVLLVPSSASALMRLGDCPSGPLLVFLLVNEAGCSCGY